MELAPINKNEALRYMQYKGNTPDQTISDMVDRCELILRSSLRPAYVYRIFDVETTADGEIKPAGIDLVFHGSAIKHHLHKADKLVMLCATLSSNADRIIRQAQIGNMTESLIFDALANAAVEQVCDAVCFKIREVFPEYFQTTRFSPGYGDFPLDIQKSFIDITDASRRIGVTVNNSNLLIPMKSVTAVIGLSLTEFPKEDAGCSCCSTNKTCRFRKDGTHCGA